MMTLLGLLLIIVTLATACLLLWRLGKEERPRPRINGAGQVGDQRHRRAQRSGDV
jgi:hypothetical protein